METNTSPYTAVGTSKGSDKPFGVINNTIIKFRQDANDRMMIQVRSWYKAPAVVWIQTLLIAGWAIFPLALTTIALDALSWNLNTWQAAAIGLGITVGLLAGMWVTLTATKDWLEEPYYMETNVPENVISFQMLCALHGHDPSESVLLEGDVAQEAAQEALRQTQQAKFLFTF